MKTIDFISLVLDLAQKTNSARMASVMHQLKHLPLPIIQTAMDDYNYCRVTNYIYPAKTNTNKIVITAHYDVLCGYGYNDNASGMAVATQLLKCDELPDNVEIVFTDHEERGGKGAAVYCKNIEANSVVANINLDVVGLPGKVFYELYNPANKFALNLINENLIRTYSIPFNDSQIFSRYDIPSILVLTGASEASLITDIFKAEHGGINDDNINMLSNDTMNLVYNTVLNCINTFNGEDYHVPDTESQRKKKSFFNDWADTAELISQLRKPRIDKYLTPTVY